MFANHISDKGFVSRISKLSWNPNYKTPNQIKVGKLFEQTPHHRRYIEGAWNKHMERCSMLLVIRERQIKAIIG